MKNYIVFDLEWNQSANGKEKSIPHFPFEIIEIGAVKLNEAFQMTDEFHRLIRPQVYTQMHHAISEVTHMNMKELQKDGNLFPDAAFLVWGGCRILYLGKHGSVRTAAEYGFLPHGKSFSETTFLL